MKYSLDMQTTTEGLEANLCLWGELNIGHANEIKAVLMDGITQADSVKITFGEVAAMDTSFLQMLCAAHIECFTLQKKITIPGGQDSHVSAFFRAGGFFQQLGCVQELSQSCIMKAICN